MLQENLKQLRLQKGLSQGELADRLSVVRQTVSKWETGLSVPDAEMLIKLADIFEVPVGILLGETVQPDNEKTELQHLADKLEHLNAMMAERNARSRTLMRIAAICLIVTAAVFAAAELLSLFVAGVYLLQSPQPNTSVGIIGGADGPTSVFVTASPNWWGLALTLILFTALLTLGLFLLRKSKKHDS